MLTRIIPIRGFGCNNIYALWYRLIIFEVCDFKNGYFFAKPIREPAIRLLLITIIKVIKMINTK